MDKLSRLSQNDRDNLTAYLDGELDDDGTRHIESILSNSDVARNDVEVLARTYDLLDALPRSTASSDFTERTVATAKLETYRKPLSQQVWFRKAKQGVLLAGISLVFVAVATAGFAITNRAIKSEDDVLLDQLPLIQNYDQYSQVHDIEFLKKLKAETKLRSEIQRGIQP